MPRLLFLGAGHGQQYAIERAIALGHQVTTVDNVPTNVGHRLAHARLDCSTRDVERLLALCGDGEYDGVRLGTPGPSPAAAARLCDKWAFRELQAECGLPHPAYRSFAAGLAESEVEALAGRVVVKPLTCSGSRGVTMVDGRDRAALASAIAFARTFARGEAVLIEDVIPGVEVGGDAMMRDGRLARLFVTEKHVWRLVPRGHSFPPRVGSAVVAAIGAQLEAVCRAVGYRSGPLNFDVMCDGDAVQIIEMSPRLGGNGIAQLIQLCYGVDMVAENLAFATGATLPASTAGDAPLVRRGGTFVLGAPEDGVLTGHARAESAPLGFELRFFRAPGDRVRAMRDGGDTLGLAIFSMPDGASYAEWAERAERAAAVRVRADHEEQKA
jgi:biotin carboxylase